MDGHVFGIKLVYAVIGFFGAICSLKFIQNLNKWEAISAVFVGTNAAVFGTGYITEQLQVTTENGQFLLCWLIGLTAINTVPLIIKVAGKINFETWIKK